jgi:hypothetical protein
MRDFKKLGHQAPKGARVNRFNSIEIDGDFAYCKSHNFLYNSEDEEEKLYNAQPCYYTDCRFSDTPFNFYHNTKIHWTRFKSISLKSCIRRTLQCKNIPVGTVVQFNKSWFYPGKNIDLSYHFKIRKENKLDIQFEINHPQYFRKFTSCKFSQELTERLREEGFIVGVRRTNPNFISGMISKAAEYLGKKEEINKEDGEIAVAYGYGKLIGFSSFDNSFMGYSIGCDSVLYDKHGEFNKWSQCHEILKDSSIDDIVNKLKT